MCKLAARSGGSAALALGFFALVATLVPLGVGADLALAGAGGGAASCGSARCWRRCLSLDRLFQGDFEDGSLDLIALSPLPLELTALAKIAAHWLSTGLPLTLLSPLLALMFNLPPARHPGAVFLAPDRNAGGQRHRRHRRQPDPVAQAGRPDPAADHPAAAGAGRDFRRRRGDCGAGSSANGALGLLSELPGGFFRCAAVLLSPFAAAALAVRPEPGNAERG